MINTKAFTPGFTIFMLVSMLLLSSVLIYEIITK